MKMNDQEKKRLGKHVRVSLYYFKSKN